MLRIIDKKDFTKLKTDLEIWLDSAFQDGAETSYYSEGFINKENEKVFDYDNDIIKVSVSAITSVETGGVIKSFFDEIEVLGEDGIPHMGNQVNENQIEQLNQIIKAI